jgi:hypothetical protein
MGSQPRQIRSVFSFSSALRPFATALAFASGVAVLPSSAKALQLSGYTGFGYPMSSSTQVGGIPETGTSTSVGFLFGGSVVFDLFPMLGIEIGGFLEPRSLETRGANGRTTLYDFRFVNVPLYLRFEPFDFLSVAVGAYTAIGVGGVDTRVSQGGQGLRENLGYAETGFTNVDYGFTFAINYIYALLPRVKALAEFRYQLGMANLAAEGSARESMQWNHLQLLIGARFDVF